LTTTDIAGPLADLGIPSTALWREIFESMTVYAGVASRDGVVLGVNQAPLHAAGLQITDVMGRQVWDTYWWSYSEEIQQEIRAVLRSALQGNTVRRELMVRMKDDLLVAVHCATPPAG
jgi:PAS domain S-box-containing protein